MSQLPKTSEDQQISQHPQKCGYFVPSKIATPNKLAPYSKSKKSVSLNNSPMHKEEKQPSLASPTIYQTSFFISPSLRIIDSRYQTLLLFFFFLYLLTIKSNHPLISIFTFTRFTFDALF